MITQKTFLKVFLFVLSWQALKWSLIRIEHFLDTKKQNKTYVYKHDIDNGVVDVKAN